MATEAVGEDVEFSHGQVHLATLDLAYVASVDARGVRQLLLRKPFRLSNFYKPPAEISVQVFAHIQPL